MRTYEIAPGSILQRMYLKQRLKALNLSGKRFLEVGAGTGYQSRILLEFGMKGKGLDLNDASCAANAEMNAEFILQKSYSVENTNFFELPETEKYDVIISCMVIEHLSDADVSRYFHTCKRLLNPGGIVITFVPSSMKYWGIEDEIAGHYKRYTYNCFEKIAQECDLKIQHMAGLTYPLSNMLFGLSNTLVKKAEGHKEELSMEDRTVLSSNRKVMFKTDYPWYFRLALNEITMLPFFTLQAANLKNNDAMVIYNEMKIT